MKHDKLIDCESMIVIPSINHDVTNLVRNFNCNNVTPSCNTNYSLNSSDLVIQYQNMVGRKG